MRRQSVRRRRQSQPELLEAIEHTVQRNLWRDLFFLLASGVALAWIGFSESHAGGRHTNEFGIADAGFWVTTPIHTYLAAHRSVNNALAAANSVLLILPGLYVAYVTMCIGDYSLVFRILFAELLRSFCGWFTYLPPDPSYLPSKYDFPDILECLTSACEAKPVVLPFVSFFSGHVAIVVLCANHLLLTGHRRLAALGHVANAAQIVRLLATRGHYSIDIVIAWYVAVDASRRAGRLGRYYSRCEYHRWPGSAEDAVDFVTGVGDARQSLRWSQLLRRTEMDQLLQAVEEEDEQSGLVELTEHYED